MLKDKKTCLSKVCTKCGKNKQILEFRANPRYADGFVNWCKDCHKLANSAWYEKNKEKQNEKAAEWRSLNRDKANEISRRFHSKNKECRGEYNAKWSKENKEKRRCYVAKRNALKISAIPPWADMSKIKEIYLNCPDGFQVDHIVPITSAIVCGLHCESNLQYLTPYQNQSKKNYWWPDMPEDAQRQVDMFVQPVPKMVQEALL